MTPPTMTHDSKVEETEERLSFAKIKEYWGVHIGPKSGQFMQEKVLLKIYLKLKAEHDAALHTHHAELDAKLEGMKATVKDMHPEATLNPLDEDTAFWIMEKNGFNAGLTAAQSLLRNI